MIFFFFFASQILYLVVMLIVVHSSFHSNGMNSCKLLKSRKNREFHKFDFVASRAGVDSKTLLLHTLFGELSFNHRFERLWKLVGAPFKTEFFHTVTSQLNRIDVAHYIVAKREKKKSQ